VKDGADAMLCDGETKKKYNTCAAEIIRMIKYMSREDITAHTRNNADAILAIYRQMQSKRKHININELMVSINQIINENIEIQQTDAKGNGLSEPRQFDISQIDFALLAKEFSRIKRKNIMLKDLEDLIQDRLSSMLETNPSRVDYYQRYMEIIDAYNSEQDRTTIEKTFMDLMTLAQQMSAEEQRYVREGFSSDEELSIYDLLFSDNLSKNDIAKIKKLATELLKKIKERISQMDHWTDKDETKATVQNLIRDELYMNIPDSMFDQLDHYREVIYEHVYTHYKEAVA
jgi:type I restriction enzyme R subunit